MKLELMAALVHGPEILFLDEPTIGLDVVAKARVRTFLAEVNKLRGTTILVTSHDMDDIEALCSRVMIIDHGRLQYDGGLDELVRTARPRKLVRATYAHAVDGGRLAEPRRSRRAVDGTDQVVKLEVERERAGDVLEQLTRIGPLVDLDVADADIEEIMRDLFLRRSTLGDALMTTLRAQSPRPATDDRRRYRAGIRLPRRLDHLHARQHQRADHLAADLADGASRTARNSRSTSGTSRPTSCC